LICALIFLSLLVRAQTGVSVKNYSTVTIGAQQFNEYLPLLKGKRVGIVTNITGLVGKTSIVDTLLKLKVKVKRIFGPEHGFRSDADAGETVKSNKDKKTGVSIISLYGSNRKPGADQLKDLDVLIYDIQDVGVRFYTYISTLAYVMEACAESGKDLIVLDRPNPNGFYIDGPIMTDKYKSFLGMHNIPVVYGMTCGEYAMMVNGEGWLKNGIRCKLKVIKLLNYDRDCAYSLPVKPSPNIPNDKAVLLYPSLGLFEGTLMSLGRGTTFPFQVTGHPEYPVKSFSFMPVPTSISKEPKYFNQVCYGMDLRQEPYLEQHPRQISLQWIKTAYATLNREDFFDQNFNYHSGNSELQEQLKNNVSEEEIRKSWQQGLTGFKTTRKKYLLYADHK